MKVVKHPPYCLFTRETRILSYRFSLHNWRLMSQKARRTRHFANSCLPRLAQKRLLCRLNLYVGGLNHGRLITKTTPRNKSAKPNVNITRKTVYCDVFILEFWRNSKLWKTENFLISLFLFCTLDPS